MANWPTPQLAKLVRVERVGQSFRLEINGEPFLYALAGDESIETHIDPSLGLASLRFTLFAERLELIDEPVAGSNDDA